MERNKYIIKSFQTKIKDIEVRASKDNRLVTSHEKKTILHYKRYIEFASGADFTLRRDNVTDCITNPKPMSYWGSSIFIAHCLFQGNKVSYNGLLAEMGFDDTIDNNNNKNKNKNKNKNNNKRKVRAKPKRNLPRKPQLKNMKRKKPLKPKPKLFSTSSNAFAKFKKDYIKLPTISTGKKSYAPRPEAIARNLDLCNPPDASDMSQLRQCIDKMSIPMKENVTAYYIDRHLRQKPLGYVEKSEIKTYNPLLFNGCGVSTFTINRNATYFILSPVEDDANKFKIYKPFVKLLNEWSEWDENKFHNDFFKKEIDDLLDESDNSSSGNQTDESVSQNNNNVERQEEEIETEESEKEESEKEESQKEESQKEEIEKEEIDEFEVDYDKNAHLINYLNEHDLNVPNVINGLLKRSKPCKISELALIPENELNEFMKNDLKIDCIQRVRFRQMIKEYKAYYRQCLENL